MERDAKQLYDNLNSNKKNNTKIEFGFFEELDHGDTLHLAVYVALNAIFKVEKE